MRKKLPYILIAVVAGLLFLPFLGKVPLFDWDEINFAECAREMLVTKQYALVTINYIPFWEKPPLFIWFQALSMSFLGVTEYAARLPNAICGIATLLLLFYTGSLIKDRKFGYLWVLSYAGSLLPFFYFKSGIIDPWFNFFIFSGVYCFMRVQMDKKKIIPCNQTRYFFLSSLCIGLAIMTKGPVALIIFLITMFVYIIFNLKKRIISFLQLILMLIVILLSGSAWFVYEIISGHSELIDQFIWYQIRLFTTEDSGHGGPFYYHFIVLLVGCFPSSILAIREMLIFYYKEDKIKETSRWMSALFWVTLLLFSFVKTKILHYSSLCYFPLTFYAALAAYRMIYEYLPWKKWVGWGLYLIGGGVAFALIALPVIAINKQGIINSGILKDRFAIANLDSNVYWSYSYCLIGLILLGGIISGVYYFKRGKSLLAVILIFGSTLITTNLALVLIAPKIEQYTQDAAIEFYKTLDGKDVYISTLGYKSYAQYFYSGMLPKTNSDSRDENWLLRGNIDKPAYFVCKVDKSDDYERKYPWLTELYRKNGFVFLERQKVPFP